MTKETKLFGTDGIRGIVGEYPFKKKSIEEIAKFSALVLKAEYGTDKVIIGWDTRESSYWISKILSKTFSESGYKVYLSGVFTTAGVAYHCKKQDAIGVMISASHNPYQYNGIKFLSPNGTKIPTELEEKIEDLIKNKNIRLSKKSKSKIVDCHLQFKKEYLYFLKQTFCSEVTSVPNEDISLVVDCGNGATSEFISELFPQLFLKFKVINSSPNGKNINHNCGAVYPQKVVENMRIGQIGITFDGDADRVILVDEKKEIRDGDYIIGVLATEYKKKRKLRNSLVVVSVMSNLGLLKYLWSKNIKVIQCPVGDKYVSEYLEKYGGNLGGEQAGHVVLYDYLPTGDGMLTALEVIKTVINNKKTLYQLCQIFDKYPQVIRNVRVSEKPPLENIFDEKFIKDLEDKIQGRIVLRYSGTEPLFRIMAEGKNKVKVQQVTKLIEKKFLEYIKNYDKIRC